MWGREMRAGLVFVLVSLLAGSAFREWRRTHEVRFADLVRDLETTDATRRASGGSVARPARGASSGDSTASWEPSRGEDHRSGTRGARRAEPALRPEALDVDRATAAELERLPGIGPSLASRIVADREQNGLFGTPEGLRRVKGIGPRTLQRIRPYLAAPRAPADSGSPIAN